VGDMVDIGAFKGRISISLAQALKDTHKNDRVYAIEANLFGTKFDLLNNINRFRVKEWVVPIFKHSACITKRWKAPLKFIWADTDGNYFSGKSDFLLWEPHLLKGGIIAFGCANSAQINRLVEDCIIGSGRFREVTKSGSMVFAYKDKEKVEYSKWKIFVTRMLYGLYYLIKKMNYCLGYKIFPKMVNCSSFKKIINKFFEIVLKL
jgi:hypothetical protein